MHTFLPILPAIVVVLAAQHTAAAAPAAALEPQHLVVTAPGYRATFHRWKCDLQLELRDGAGPWRTITKTNTSPEFAVSDAQGVHSTLGAPVRICHANVGDAVAVGVTTLLPGTPPMPARAHFLCADEGLLIRFETPGAAEAGSCWSLPRLALDETLFDAYAFWPADDQLRSGSISALGQSPAYAGVSPWGHQGDTAARLSPRHPAVVAVSPAAGLALGAICLDYEARAAAWRSFLQRYDAHRTFFYPALVDRKAAAQDGWAWLVPLPLDPAAAAAKVERLLIAGRALAAGFRPIAPPPDESWSRSAPDFPAALRRDRPVADIRQAVVYTINETILSDDGVDLARKAGSDVLIRGWFKWNTAPDYARLAPLVPRAHELGALFGGGITCSALYHGESGLSAEQVRDMATRGPQGQLIDAWGQPDCRHGTLSNPAYLQFLLSSCRKQIDQGVDVLFMDEINAALQADEGFDDYSLADFRQFLVDRYAAQGWTAADARWQSTYHVRLADRDVAPDHTMRSFQYRAYLKSLGLSSPLQLAGSPLAADWHAFRRQRDDRAWKWLTDAIRAYAAAGGRRVLINANGLARDVDLQVLGVWDHWRVKQGRIDLSESQLDAWGSTVIAGWGLAGRRVPVVLFHDWGFGGFPWMEVPPDDRRLWIRVRGAEIYAAGGFFAFPVHGPEGNDSRQDGTLAEIARQSRFYHRHQDLYLDAELLGFEPLETPEPGLSLALWKRSAPPMLILHVINRQADEGQPRARASVAVDLPCDRLPQSVRVISPDGPAEEPGTAQIRQGKLRITIPRLEAYSVALLSFDPLPQIALSGRRIVPVRQWARPSRNQFVVHAGGLVGESWELPGMLQGMLHQPLRNPPSLLVNMPQGGSLAVHVRGVATRGARLQWQVDGRVEKVLDLPDRDGKNEALAREYDETFEFPIPAGRHTVTLDNVGGDWACIAWYAVNGQALEP